MYGPTYIVWANPTPFSLQLSLGEMATIKMTSDCAWGAKGIPGLVPGGKDERSGAAIQFEVELVCPMLLKGAQ
jgi:hypothetical protein